MTRGTYGFFHNGESKLTYSPSDSMPNSLGIDLIKQLKTIVKKYTPSELEEIFNEIEMIDSDYNSTSDLLKIFKQKNMYNANTFIQHSLTCDWGYVINLSDWTFEIYKGMQTIPNSNRYSIEIPNNNIYYSCALVEKIPLEQIDHIKMLHFNSELNTIIVEYSDEYEELKFDEDNIFKMFDINVDKLTEYERLKLVEILDFSKLQLEESSMEKDQPFLYKMLNKFLQILNF